MLHRLALYKGAIVHRSECDILVLRLQGTTGASRFLASEPLSSKFRSTCEPASHFRSPSGFRPVLQLFCGLVDALFIGVELLLLRIRVPGRVITVVRQVCL